MLLRPTELEAIRDGRIDLAFSRWDRPRLLVGTRMRTAVGLVEVTEVAEVAPEAIAEADARRAGLASLAELRTRLERHHDRPVFRVGLRFAGADPRVALRNRADLPGDERALLAARLERLDRASRHGPWTAATLAIIARSPQTRAADLAADLGRDTAEFKRDVRKLKELGLTESLEIGYRLSPRGEALVATHRRAPLHFDISTRSVEPG
jgi:hypothetical protein